MFEKKDSSVKSAAATNLSFLYYLVSSAFHNYVGTVVFLRCCPRRGLEKRGGEGQHGWGGPGGRLGGGRECEAISEGGRREDLWS